jgi:hypothetical protein
MADPLANQVWLTLLHVVLLEDDTWSVQLFNPTDDEPVAVMHHIKASSWMGAAEKFFRAMQDGVLPIVAAPFN